MKHRIDPTIDCVFKAILGREENKNLLIHFLNAVLEFDEGFRVQEVVILNPYNERDYIENKLSIVDIKAKDEKSRYYQVEIQLAVRLGLEARMLYNWSSIYHASLGSGDDFGELKPVISIWILRDSLFPNIEDYHFPFVLYNPSHAIRLTNHLAIHLLELPKWHLRDQQDDIDRWMYFFKEGNRLDIEHPPEILCTEEMRQAMSVLKQFSESEKEYLLYESRLNAQRELSTWKTLIKQKTEEAEREKKRAEQAEKEKEQAEKEKEQAEKEKEQAEKEKERIRREYERIRALLEKAGVNPDDE